MIKSLIKRVLRAFGLQVTRVPRQQTIRRSLRRAASQPGRRDFVQRLAKDPLDADLHLQYALHASKAGRPYLAYAELKTAECLGAGPKQVERHSDAFRQALPDPIAMNHNLYFRFVSLSSEIAERAVASDPSILDVGGGEGQLASFLPHATYCLVEPRLNGISGTSLPFPDRSFDYVVSCHVLEHIPVDERGTFLDQLLSKSVRGVILLNPFHVEGTHVEDRLNLFAQITGTQWAKEHLDCHLPSVQDLRDYADQRGLEFCIKPNGTIAVTTAFVFLDNFAARAGFRQDWKKVNRFFNEKYTPILDSEAYPTAYLIYLGRPSPSTPALQRGRPG